MSRLEILEVGARAQFVRRRAQAIDARLEHGEGVVFEELIATVRGNNGYDRLRGDWAGSWENPKLCSSAHQWLISPEISTNGKCRNQASPKKTQVQRETCMLQCHRKWCLSRNTIKPWKARNRELGRWLRTGPPRQDASRHLISVSSRTHQFLHQRTSLLTAKAVPVPSPPDAPVSGRSAPPLQWSYCLTRHTRHRRRIDSDRTL